jgi:HSP20 family molecular chaperone IbpA
MLYPSIFGEKLFDDFFDDMFKPAKQVRALNQVPSVMRTDIRERDDAFDLHIELPGYTKEDVKAQLTDGYLTISAQTKKEDDQKDENGKFIRRERYYGSCSRSFYVGEEVKEEDIKAKFENGILTISVPKKDAKKEEIKQPKYIAIEG